MTGLTAVCHCVGNHRNEEVSSLAVALIALPCRNYKVNRSQGHEICPTHVEPSAMLQTYQQPLSQLICNQPCVEPCEYPVVRMPHVTFGRPLDL